VFRMADIVLGEEAVEVPGILDGALERIAIAAPNFEDADQGTAKGSGYDRDRRRLGPPVRFCWAAFQSDDKHYGS
jgi:hypothetical protein